MFGKSILFSEMVPEPGWEGAFNDWYDGEHIPLRVAAPGFVSAQRYLGPERNYLAVYETQSLEAFKTPEYTAIKTQPSELTRRMLKDVSGFTRYLGNEISRVMRPGAEAIDPPLLYAVWFNVPTDRLADFDAWYEQDHAPILMKCAQWLGIRRFDIVDGDPVPFNRLAIHYLADRAALDSPERAEARATPWRARIAAEPWFAGSYKVFERHGARQMHAK